MNIDWYYSDPHFGHANILKYASRPFDSIEAHDAALVANYSERVLETDRVLWLGDCFFGSPERFGRILQGLPGRKWLVKGNHDLSERRMLQLGFELVTERLHYSLADRHVLACHFPPKQAVYKGQTPDVKHWTKRPDPVPGLIVIHGHTHEKLRAFPGRVHVGVDAWGYAPVPAREVERLVRGLK